MGVTLGHIMPIILDYWVVALITGVLAGYLVRGVSGSKKVGVVAGILICMAICIMPCIDSPRCIECDATMKYGQAYCGECGTENEVESILREYECEVCGRRISSKYKLCTNCGTAIN